MPRRRPPAEDDVSLFPFLSIIACVIGVLTMMIATLALAQTDTQDVARIEAYEKTTKQLSILEQQIASLRKQIEATNADALQARSQQQELTITVEELQRLLAELAQIEWELAEQQKVKINVPTLDPAVRETMSDLQSQHDQLQQQLARMQSELAQRQGASEAKVTVLPQGTGLDFVPHFVECTEGAVVMHHLPEPKRIRAGEIAKDPDFLALLETAANGASDTIVFLLRNDGLNVYNACKKMCDDREIRNGKLPVVGKGRIDLSAFTNQ